MNSKTGSFDSAASSYDEIFTLSEIGMRQRNRVYHWLDVSGVLKRNTKIFELNCGTGYDAEVFLKHRRTVVATDASAEMIKVAKSKRSNKIQFYERNFHDISIDDNILKSNLVFSNFGGLNCLNEIELTQFVIDLSKKQKTGDHVALVIMPKHCITEDLYLFVKGRFSEIGRRNKRGFVEVDVNGEKIKTFYHSPDDLKRLLKKDYNITLIKPIAHFLPPSYLEPFFKNNRWMLRYLNFMERTFGRLSFLASNADHFIIIAERK